MLILDLWGISFHAVVVFGLGKDLLFKSVLGRYELRTTIKFPNLYESLVLLISTQRPRTDLNKRSLPRPKTTTA